MSNPFYIPQQQEPKRNDLATILAALKLGIDAYGTWQQGDIAEKKLEATTAAAAQSQEWEERKHADTMASQEDTRLQHAAAENAKLPYHQQSYGYGDHMKLSLKAKDVGDDPNILNFSKQLAADKTVTKMDAWQMFRENDELRQSAIESLTKKVQSASEKGAKEGVNYLETKEGQADYERLQALSDPENWKKIVDANFQETATSYTNAQAKAKKEASFAPVNVDGVGLVDPNTRAVLVPGVTKPTEASLYRDAAAGDQTAAAALAAMQAGKIKVARESRPPSTAPTWRTFEKDGVTYQESSRGELKTVDKGTKETPAEIRQTDKMVADAELKVLSNRSNDAAASEVDIVNQYSKKPYSWQWKPGKIYGGTWEKVKLPVMNGKQVTANEVYYTAQKNGTTYEEVLRKIGAIK